MAEAARRGLQNVQRECIRRLSQNGKHSCEGQAPVGYVPRTSLVARLVQPTDYFFLAGSFALQSAAVICWVVIK
ncbi:hypothetical protein EC915_107130 [Pseudomonas sp. LP_7_YM]|nr:hypothetical protein EC915_107130 [Pseudomonas sp. LP_7_YM]